MPHRPVHRFAVLALTAAVPAGLTACGGTEQPAAVLLVRRDT